MSNATTRTQLAQALDISIDDIHDVVHVIQKQLGEPVPNIRLLEMARDDPEFHKKFKQVEKKVKNYKRGQGDQPAHVSTSTKPTPKTARVQAKTAGQKLTPVQSPKPHSKSTNPLISQSSSPKKNNEDEFITEFASLLEVSELTAKHMYQAIKGLLERRDIEVDDQKLLEIIRESKRSDWKDKELVDFIAKRTLPVAKATPEQNERAEPQLPLPPVSQVSTVSQVPPVSQVTPVSQDLPVSQTIIDAADLLVISVEEADTLFTTVREQVSHSPTNDEILETLIYIDLNDWTIDRIIRSIKASYIARIIPIPESKAFDLPRAIKDRFKLEVTYDDILQFIETATSPISTQDIFNYFYSEWRSSYDIAQLLGISEDEAWQYIRSINKTISWAVPPKQLLETITSLPADRRDPISAAQFLEESYIAQQLQLSIEETHEMLQAIQEECEPPVSNSDIIVTLPYFKRTSSESYAKQFIALHLISSTLQISLTDTRQYVQAIQDNFPNPISHDELLTAFNAVPISQKSSVPVIVLKLNEQRLAEQLGFTLQQLTEWSEVLSEMVGSPINPQQIAEAIESQGELASVQSVEAHFQQKYYPIPQIATAAGKPAHSVPKFLRKIRHEAPRAIQDEEILKILNALPPTRRSKGDVLAYLYAQNLITDLNIDVQQVDNLFSTLQKHGKNPLSVKQIISLLDVLPKEEQTENNLVGLSEASQEWGKSYSITLKTASAIIEKTVDTVTLEQFWSIVKQADPILQNEDGLIVYLDVRYVLRAANTDPKTLNRLAKALFQLPNDKAFWDFVKNSYAPDKLTAKDLDQFLLQIEWLTFSNRFLTPNPNREEGWITSQYLKEISHSFPPSTSRNEQSPKLMKYRQECWREINSSSRNYQVPSEGRAEIRVSDLVKNRINLFSVRFVQESVTAPGLFIQFKFGNPAIIGIVKIDPQGTNTGFHHLIDDRWFQSMIAAVAMAHYRDLVVPNHVKSVYQQMQRSHRSASMYSSRDPKAPKSFPVQRDTNREYDLHDWYEAQDIALHHVRGHVRRTEDPYFVADPAKQLDAQKAGVTLGRGETWVVEHRRGNPQHIRIKLNGTELINHTVFKQPPKASYELSEIFESVRR